LNAHRPLTSPSLPYQALWEMAAGRVACRVLICSATLAADEFAGMVAGYLGGGHSLIEPFHVRFVKDQAKHLIVGDLNALTRQRCFSETWPAPVRRSVAQCRAHLRTLVVESADGLWVATPAEQRRLKALTRDEDCARSGDGRLDERVWSTISAHFGAPAGLEL
jgi:hypothetical protein